MEYTRHKKPTATVTLHLHWPLNSPQCGLAPAVLLIVKITYMFKHAVTLLWRKITEQKTIKELLISNRHRSFPYVETFKLGCTPAEVCVSAELNTFPHTVLD